MKIPGYTIQRELGHGGMSTVYLAIQDSLQRPVALKIMSPVLSNEPRYVERFMQEGRIVANLAHPFIVTIYDVGVIDSQPYMAMEYMEGGTLQQRIEKGLTLPELFPIIQNVAQALAYAHARDVVHRDVKPGNIMFHADGKALLGDFGIAKAVGGDAATANLQTGAMALGTPYYMSPEQVLRRPVDARVDQYGLGVVVYECLTGRVPFQASDPFSVSLKHLTDPIPRLTGEAAIFQPLLNRLMAKEPQDRYPDDQMLLAELNALAAGVTVQRQAPITFPGSTDTPKGTDARTELLATPMFTQTAPSRRKHWPLWLIALLLTIGLGAALSRWHVTPEPAVSPPQVEEVTPVRMTEEMEDSRLLISRAGDPRLPGMSGDEPLITLDPELAMAIRTMSGSVDSPEIRALLEQAEQHLVNDRLTIPVDANAYAVYQQVLIRAPEHPQALAGLEAIADRYVELASAARNRGRISGARQLVERGLTVQPNHDRLMALRRQLQGAATRTVDPCERDRGSRACWCQTFGMFCD